MAVRQRTRVLVGREHQIDLLAKALTHAATGEPGVLVVAGEAGVGKTSLVEYSCSDADATVLVGNSVPMAGATLPFAPIVQALRELARSSTARERERLLRHWPDELTRLVPLDDAEDAADPRSRIQPAPDLGTPISDSGQGRLFESMLSLLAELASARPVVLVVEDLHWSDPSTLDLIAFLAWNLRTEHVLLLLTVRTDDLVRGDPLRGWLAELTRLPHVQKLTLQRLGRDDTERQVAGLLGSAPDADLVDLVHERAAGNPMFTEQVLPWMRDPSRQLPDTLRELVEARLGDLPAPTRRVLEVVSVLGQRVRLDELTAVVGSSDSDMEEALRVAVDRQLVEPCPGPTYAFRHPLFGEVLQAGLLPGDRRRLHAAAARTLEAGPKARPADAFVLAGRLARHWESAEAAGESFAASVRAGLAAEEVFAFAGADEHLGRAVELASELPTEAFDGVPLDPSDLLAHASQAANLVGDGVRAVRLADRAIEQSADRLRRAHLLERRGTYCFKAGIAEGAEQSYRDALDLLPDERPSVLRARVLAGLALVAMAWTRMDDAHQWGGEAIRVARAVGARKEEGMALNALGVVTAYDGDFEAAVAHSRLSLEIAEELGQPDELASAYIHLTHVLGMAGRHQEAVEVCSVGYQAMSRLGLARQDGAFLQTNAAESLFKSGRWDEAEELIETALAQHPRGVRAWPILAQSVQLDLGRGRLSVAAQRLDQVHALADEHGMPDSWQRECHESAAELALWQQRPDEALAAAETGLTLVESGDEQRFAAPLVLLAARALADLAEAARARRDDGELQRMLAQGEGLLSRAHRLRPDPLDADRHPLPESGAVALSVRAEIQRARGAASPEDWSAAATAWDDVGRPFPAAYGRWREAEVAVSQVQTGARPAAAVRAAHHQARSLGADGLVTEIEQLARWARVELLPAQREADSAGTLPPDVGLTSREREVLASLVDGCSNREIAESLFISVKTASVHVSNILRKLDVTSRGDAARAAHRLGLVGAR